MSIKSFKNTFLGKALIILCLIIAASILIFMKQSDRISFALGSKEKTHMRIGIVNQDEGEQFNSSQYNFGEDFTKLLAKDENKKTSWKVMSRDQAESKYKDDSLEAIIYIPKDFSHNILQLSSFNPEKAKITYKVKESVEKEQSLEMAQQVGEYVNTLNQETIRLYFTSVINNLDSAKRQMNTIVSDGSDIFDSLNTSISQPAERSIQSLDNIPSIAESVQSSNKTFEESVASFKKSTADLLNNNAESLLGQTDPILKYKEAQSQVTNHNAQVASNFAKAQFDKDNELYLNLYKNLNGYLYNLGNRESSPGSNESESYLVRLEKSINAYNKKVEASQEQIAQSRKDLETLKASLEESRGQVAQNYFDGTTVDTSSFAENDADILNALNTAIDKQSVRQALAKQVVSTLSNSDQLPGDYDNQVNSTIASISVNSADYVALFAKLKELGVLTDTQISAYSSKLDLLAQYASVKGSTTGSMPAYSFITVANDALPSSETKTILMSHVYPTVTNERNGANKYTATPIRVTNIQLQGIRSATIVPSKDTIIEPTDLQLQIQYSPSFGLNTISFDLEVGKEKIPLQYTFYFDKNKGSNALVQTDLSNIFEQLSRIDTAATTIKNIYGSPSSSTTIDISNPAKDSVAKMYGNISTSTVAEKLKEDDVDKYRQSGIDLYAKLSKQINQLNLQASSLPKLEKSELPNDYFATTIDELSNWYESATNKLNEEYEVWKNNIPQILEVSSTSSGVGLSATTVYTTEDTSNGLLDIVTGLSSNTKNISETITANGDKIGSMDAQFTSLAEQSKKVQEEVKLVRQETETVIKNQSKNIEEGTEFNKNFQGVLSNARSNGTDHQAVLNFLSNPIITEKTNQSSVLSTTPIWIYLLAFLLFTNIATGLIVREYIRKRRDKSDETVEKFE